MFENMYFFLVEKQTVVTVVRKLHLKPKKYEMKVAVVSVSVNALCGLGVSALHHGHTGRGATPPRADEHLHEKNKPLESENTDLTLC